MNKRKLKNNCERATFLVEKQLWTRLLFAEYLYKNIHISGCTACRVYQKQSKLINKMASKILNTEPPLLNTDDEFKDLLHFKINEHIK